MIKTAQYAIKAISERGLGFLFTYFRESVWFDWRYGTKTSSRVPKDEQVIQGDTAEAFNGLLYVASFTSVVTKSLAAARKILGDTRYQRAQFIDLGCGKGKTLMVYALAHKSQQIPRAVGIEYDPVLVAHAQENIKKCGLTEAQVTIHAESAVNVMNYVATETVIIYLYNSFQGETLHQVLTQLKAAPHILIYVDPAESKMLQEFGYEIVQHVEGRYNADTWLVATSANL